MVRVLAFQVGWVASSSLEDLNQEKLNMVNESSSLREMSVRGYPNDNKERWRKEDGRMKEAPNGGKTRV